MDSSLRDEVIRVFKDAGSYLDDKLVAECTHYNSSSRSVCFLFDVRDFTGVSICQLYVLEPDTLRYKLEAINYKSTATLSEIAPITMESLSAVKKQIQQSLAKENALKAQPKKRSTATAQVDLSKIPRHMNRANVQHAGFPVKQEPFQETTLASSSSSNVIKTSRVTFVGPPMDAEAKKKRACKQNSVNN